MRAWLAAWWERQSLLQQWAWATVAGTLGLMLLATAVWLLLGYPGR